MFEEDGNIFKCKTCGNYILTFSSEHEIKSKNSPIPFNGNQRAGLAYKIMECNASSITPAIVINKEDEEKFKRKNHTFSIEKMSDFEIKFEKKVDLWLEYLCSIAIKKEKYSFSIDKNDMETSNGILYKNDTSNLDQASFIFAYLQKLDFINFHNKTGDYFFDIKPNGLIHFENKKFKKEDSKKVFIAMPFKDKREDGLNRVEVQTAIEEACKEAGDFEAETVDIEHNNNINDEIIAKILDSLFIIADFTGNNNGVYYEAGFARGQHKDVIHIAHESCIDKPENKENPLKLHFDVEHTNFIKFNGPEQLKTKLINRIKLSILKK